MIAIGIALAYSAGLLWSTWRLHARPLSLPNFLANALFDIVLALYFGRVLAWNPGALWAWYILVAAVTLRIGVGAYQLFYKSPASRSSMPAISAAKR